MTIQIDSREKARAITKILTEFDSQSIKHFISKLPVGDYMSFDNPRLIIDRKQNLQELCVNVCQQHKRFIAEIKRAGELGIRLIFLVEHSQNVKTLDDVQNWDNPRLKVSPLAVSGQRLYKILYSIEKNYNTRFLFCSKNQTGNRIIELLSS